MPAFKIEKPQAVPYLKTLIIGKPKIGKTTFLGTSPLKTLILDFEGGDSVLPIRDNLDIVRITDLSQFDDVYDFLINDKHGYELLGIDSISEINDKMFLELLEQEADKHKRRDLNRPEIQDYNILQFAMSRLMRSFRDLPMHVIMTAHPVEILSKDQGYQQWPKMTPKKMPTIATGMMHEVTYYVRDTEGKRYLLLENFPEFGGIGCRVRDGINLPNAIEEPTLPLYFDALRGEMQNKEVVPTFFEEKVQEDNSEKETE